MDLRIQKLASNLVNYSCEVKPGENVLIETVGLELPLTKELIREVYKAGGVPFVSINNDELKRVILMNCNDEQLKLMASHEMARAKDMKAYIMVRSGGNSSELNDVPIEKIKLYNKNFQLVKEQRILHTKWVYTEYPSSFVAQKAGMSTEEFEDFYFKACNFDYAKMSAAAENLVKIMRKTNRVRITGKDTDLTFSLKGLSSEKAVGKNNLPDGEVWSAPVKNSVNGVITYNTPSEYMGFTFENVRLEFKDGKIIKATANDTERINKIFDTDEGARYIGEFAIAINPYILKPIKNILFDEKIKGSLHFTPGNPYKECDNGNKSAIHWDLVLLQTPDFGGGEIWFDDLLVRKDGIFVPEELQSLNNLAAEAEGE